MRSEARAALLSKLRVGVNQVRHVPRALGLVWRAARGWTTAWLALLVASGVLPVALVYLTRALVNGLVAAVEGGASAGFGTLGGILVAYALVLLLGEALRAVTGWVRTAQAEAVRDHVQELIQKQSTALDLDFFERADFYDRLHRATWESSFRSLALLETTGQLLQSSITLLAMMAVIVPYGAWLPLVLLLGTLPAFFIVLRYAVQQHLWWRSATRDERRVAYHESLLTGAGAAAEIRLFGLGDHFRAIRRALREPLREGRIAIERRHAVFDFTASLLALLLAGGAVVFMIWRTLQGAVSLGDLALFLQAFRQGEGMMRSLTREVGALYRNTLFLGDLHEYLELAPKLVAPADPRPVPPRLEEGIRFEGVTFAYPGRDRAALRGLDLFLPAGKTVAVVGENGAGKSTLVKLLCRLYDPSSGRVTFDGTDLREFDPVELRRRIAVLFQSPLRYHATVRENIAIGDAGGSHSGADLAAAAEAADAGAIIGRLPKGYDSVLGKVFAEGVELSSGEWQRIALARAFLRRAPVVVLDEPTSAMDPWAEVEWLRRLDRLAAGRTVLIVTHRLSTARQADLIVVLCEGRVRESGTHAELIARGGHYAGVWKELVEALR